MLCVPFCPDVSIPVKDGRREDTDLRPSAIYLEKYCGISVDGVIGNAPITSGLICAEDVHERSKSRLS